MPTASAPQFRKNRVSAGVSRLGPGIATYVPLATSTPNLRAVDTAASTSSGSYTWEQSGNLGTIRWAPPEITFSEKLQIHWDGFPVNLEYHPGSSTGSIWVVLPEQKVIFLGDSVTNNQPPFLSDSNIPVWLDTLQELLKKKYLEYIFISGRGGIIVQDQINQFVRFLKKTNRSLESLARKKLPAEKTVQVANKLINEFNFPNKYQNIYLNRLKWGLFQYYAKNHFPPQDETFIP